ncbi:hypothetical protein M3J09_009788 [Ascochyta lentis]
MQHKSCAFWSIHKLTERSQTCVESSLNLKETCTYIDLLIHFFISHSPVATDVLVARLRAAFIYAAPGKNDRGLVSCYEQVA